jgi:hypothetical protein
MKKGKHHSNHSMKNRFMSGFQTFHWQCQFDTSARYVLRNADGSIDVDQYDWSKLPGITFTPVQPMHSTAMVGWRYNITKDSIELTPYFHVDGRRFFNDDPHLTIGLTESFEHFVYLDYEKKDITVTIKTAHGELSETHHYKTFKNRVVQIHPYFGGNKRAPRNIKLKVIMDKK